MCHLSSCLQQRVHPGGFPRAQPHLQGQQELLSPHTRGTPWLGTQGALGLILYPASHRASFLPAEDAVLPAVPVGSAAAQSHQGSLISRCAGEQRKSLFANSAMKRALPSEPSYSALHAKGQVLILPNRVFAFQRDSS